MMAGTGESRNDLHLTSTGRGLEYRDVNAVFPPINFQRTATQPLPNSLTQGDNVRNPLVTTTGSAHDYKTTHLSEKYTHKKPPGHWGVNYVEDTLKKLNVKPQRKPLTMGFQTSEMRSQYQGKPGIPMATKFSSNMQAATSQHQSGSAVKATSGTTAQNISDRGVFNYHGDLYLSTTQKDHRAFTKEEKSAYPRKNYATYWECENYPKTWGHGSKSNPLPLDSLPGEKGPARDRIWFKTATTIPRLPKSHDPVPNKGLRPETLAKFGDISDAERKDLFYCPVSTPWELHGAGPAETFSVPRMYHTEYESYASRKPVMV